MKCREGGWRGLPSRPAVETVLSRPWHREPRGDYLGSDALGAFAPTFVSWTSPRGDAPWTSGSASLFWGPGKIGLRKPADASAPVFVAGLETVEDSRGGRWASLESLLWLLEPEALAPRVYGVDYALVRETRRPSSPRRGSG